MEQTVDPSKSRFLITFYQTCWDEMTWRRNAGYRTIIIGLGYCGLLLAVVAFNRQMAMPVRICLSAVIAIATLFGAGYLLSNYKKYMAAASRLVQIEKYVGAFDSDFLGADGPLCPAQRHDWPKRPITKDMVCLWSVIAFAVGGLVTALAILLV